jgi:hypothetical protein
MILAVSCGLWRHCSMSMPERQTSGTAWCGSGLSLIQGGEDAAVEYTPSAKDPRSLFGFGHDRLSRDHGDGRGTGDAAEEAGSADRPLYVAFVDHVGFTPSSAPWCFDFSDILT